MLLAIPAGGFVVFIAILGGWSVGRHGNIHYTMCAAFATSAIGTLLLTIPQLDKGRLVGFYLCPAFSLGIVLIFSSIANNVVGYTKKIFYLSSVSAANTLGCFIGPQIMLDSQKPLYIGAMVTYIACNVIAILLLLYTRYNMLITNKRRLQKPDEKVIDSEDLTDRENHNFIYRL
jgi:hypothetical protein